MYNHYFSNFGRPPVSDDICKGSAIRHPRFWRTRCLQSGILEKLGWTHGPDRWAGPMGWTDGLDPWTGLMDSGLLQVNIRSVPTNSVYV